MFLLTGSACNKRSRLPRGPRGAGGVSAPLLSQPYRTDRDLSLLISFV